MLTGHDAAYVGLPVFPHVAACRCRAIDLATDAPLSPVLVHAEARAATEQGLHMLKTEGGGSSTFAPRALLLEEPPNIDAGEITNQRYINQRYINQRALLAQRQALVQTLHADPLVAGVICI